MATESIVDRIRTLANAQGLSLPALEVKLNLGNGTISRWSKSSPNTDKLSRVADFFHVSLDYLMGRESDNTLDLIAGNVKREYTEIEKMILEEMKKRDPQVSIEETVRAVRLFTAIWNKPPAEKDALMTILGVPED
jgi:transcriptional regulator with XRE-family HTH domain